MNDTMRNEGHLPSLRFYRRSRKARLKFSDESYDYV